MDRILFGDNQFFGVNHASEDKARAPAMRFQDIEAVIGVLRDAYAEGIKTFMCTTHERMSGVCDYFRDNADKYPDYNFYPCMPYAHKYANAAAELGILGAVRSFLPDNNPLGALVKGGLSLARKDVEGLAKMLIDAEMKMFAGLKTPVVFLQNVATDFLLGLGFDEAFRIFADHIKDQYNAEPAFITMNAPRLYATLTKLGIKNPIICANINKVGFRMCGGIDAYAELLNNGDCRMVAMSIFASGALHPKEAIEWLTQYPKLRSVVFGASSRRNIAETKSLIDSLMPEAVAG